MFSVGQKVVLVDDRWPETVKRIYDQLPVLDTVYVVRSTHVGVRADELFMDKRRVLVQTLLLIGVVNAKNKAGQEHGFAASRFRALDELKQQNSDLHRDKVLAKAVYEASDAFLRRRYGIES